MIALVLFALGMALPVSYSVPVSTSDVVTSDIDSCAFDVLVGLDEAAERDNAYPVPSLSWDDAVNACQGTALDVLIYEDGSVVVIDTDYEYPPFEFCMNGEVLCRD
jgi:hypothetical protein